MQVDREHFAKLLALIEKPDVAEFGSFIEMMELAPSLESHTPTSRVCEFAKDGFDVFTHESKPKASMLCFHFASPRVVAGSASPYDGFLPYSLSPSDSKAEIQRKLGAVPRSSSKHWFSQLVTYDEYFKDSHFWSFAIDSESGQLLMLTVSN